MNKKHTLTEAAQTVPPALFGEDEILHDLKCMDTTLKTSANWNQGYMAKRSKTARTALSVKDPEASCFCLQGAAERCTPGDLTVEQGRANTTIDYLLRRLNSIPGNLYTRLWHFNDHSTTKFRDVKALLKYAIEYRTWELEVKAAA